MRRDTQHGAGGHAQLDLRLGVIEAGRVEHKTLHSRVDVCEPRQEHRGLGSQLRGIVSTAAATAAADATAADATEAHLEPAELDLLSRLAEGASEVALAV